MQQHYVSRMAGKSNEMSNRKLEQNEIEAITTQLKEINELHNELLERTPEVNPFTFLKIYNDLKHVIQDYKLELEHSRSTCH